MALEPDVEQNKYFHNLGEKESKKNLTPVVEIFGPTIQGEGMMVGEKTLFIRTGGCDFRCAKCDSMHAVDPLAMRKNSKWMPFEDILFELDKLSPSVETPWVTISGGNPAMWDLTSLVIGLHQAGYKVAVETQGSIWRPWLAEVDCLTICPKGPGMGERFEADQFNKFLIEVGNSPRRLQANLEVCIKHVIFGQDDFEFAAQLDRVLDEHGSCWPKEDRYLSLGNHNPPRLKGDGTGEFVVEHTEDFEKIGFVDYLLTSYQILLEDFLKDPRLGHWKFLPQLHVLVWGNATCK